MKGAGLARYKRWRRDGKGVRLGHRFRENFKTISLPFTYIIGILQKAKDDRRGIDRQSRFFILSLFLIPAFSWSSFPFDIRPYLIFYLSYLSAIWSIAIGFSLSKHIPLGGIIIASVPLMILGSLMESPILAGAGLGFFMGCCFYFIGAVIRRILSPILDIGDTIVQSKLFGPFITLLFLVSLLPLSFESVISFAQAHPIITPILISILGIGLFLAILRYCFPAKWYIQKLKS